MLRKARQSGSTKAVHSGQLEGASRAGEVPAKKATQEDFLSWRLLACCVGFRVLNALCVQTFFSPDEYWQSLEVAHHMAFGYGHLTWEWRAGIRSYLHPLPFALLYKLLALLGLDSASWLSMAPKFMQAVLAGGTDYATVHLAARMSATRGVVQWALFCHLTSWFNFFCSTRTFSNCAEHALTTMALSLWPFKAGDGTRSRPAALIIAAVACAIRPTGCVFWAYLCLVQTQRARPLQFVLLEVIPVAVGTLLLSVGIDRLGYGRWVLSMWNFFRFNVVQGGSAIYGSHPWHWYLTQGIPVLLGPFLPFLYWYGSGFSGYCPGRTALRGVPVFACCRFLWRSVRRGHIPPYLLPATLVVFLYSTQAHKEFRFLLQIMSLLLIYCADMLATVCDGWPPRSFRNRFLVGCLLAVNASAGLYFACVHQRGTIQVMPFLAEEARSGILKDALFLMPCHHTPLYSYVHRNIPLRILDCSPHPVEGGHIHATEEQMYFENPAGYLESLYGAGSMPLPTHIVMYTPHVFPIEDFLNSRKYERVFQTFHAHLRVDRELLDGVVVFRRADEPVQ